MPILYENCLTKVVFSVYYICSTTLVNPLTSQELSMNTVPRLFFVALSIIGLTICACAFKSSGRLSDGQSLMLWSLVPASLMLFTAALHTKERANTVIAFMVMFVGAFFAMLCTGMYMQSHKVAYGIFAWLGLLLMLAGTVLGMISSTSSPSASFSRS